MPDRLSIAIGTVLATLEMVEKKHGVVENVRLNEVTGHPSNVIEFEMGDRTYEVLVEEKSFRHVPKVRPALQRVRLNITESAPSDANSTLTHSR